MEVGTVPVLRRDRETYNISAESKPEDQFMKDTYSVKSHVLPSRCDSTGRLGIPETAAMFMDIAAEHSNALGIGQNELAKSGGFWLTVKTMIRFFRRPAFAETVETVTWPEVPDRRKCLRDYTLSGDGGILACGKTEWAIIEPATGALKKVDDIYPAELELTSGSCMDDIFTRFEDRWDDAEEIGTYTVASTDVDMGHHMNNVAYIRAFASMFSTVQWNAMDISFIEVWYRAQCFEGEKLVLKRRRYEDRSEAAFVKEDGKTALLIRYVCSGC